MFWKILILLALIVALLTLSVPGKQNLEYGATFSQKFSEELNGGSDAKVGAGWKQNYLAILDDLKIKDLRLVAYWDLIEPAEGQFDFKDLDWQINEAEKRGAKIILAMGLKVPRWPECHIPDWAKGRDASARAGRLIKYEEILINRYKDNKAVWAWQVENEPYFPFGDCKIVPPAILNAEIKQVKALDSRPIVLTDAGELGFAWPYLAAKSDIFGTTLYRYINNRFLGDIRYSLIPAYYFRIKALWAGKILGKQILISELQAEPWVSESLARVPLEKQEKTMNPEIFKEIINYAERSGFPKAYLWGAEWWYWMKEKQGRPEMWEAARNAISNL